MRAWPLLACSLVLAAACGDNESPADRFPTGGGRDPAPGCGHDIVTVAGVEPPQLGGDTLGAAPAPFQVHLGLAGDPATSIAIVWRTDVDTDASDVELGDGERLDRPATGVTYRYHDRAGDTVRVHEVHVCGLQPDTEYRYRVGGAGEADSWSPIYAFRTAPDIAADPGAEVRIGLVGDTRNGYATWHSIAGQLRAQAVDLVLFTGDAVASGTDQSQWDDFFTAAGELAATTPIASVMGNHDLRSVEYFSQLALPGDEDDYAFDYGHAHVTVLDDSPADPADLAGHARQFLDDDLAAADRTWTILAHHRPFWSSGTTHGGDATLRAVWGPVVDAHHVDLVVNGHEHIYERTQILHGDTVVFDPALGTRYLVIGGGGAPLHGVDPGRWWSAVAESTHGFAIATVGPTALQVDAYRAGEDAPFDTFTTVKP